MAVTSVVPCPVSGYVRYALRSAEQHLHFLHYIMRSLHLLMQSLACLACISAIHNTGACLSAVYCAHTRSACMKQVSLWLSRDWLVLIHSFIPCQCPEEQEHAAPNDVDCLFINDLSQLPAPKDSNPSTYAVANTSS